MSIKKEYAAVSVKGFYNDYSFRREEEAQAVVNLAVREPGDGSAYVELTIAEAKEVISLITKAIKEAVADEKAAKKEKK